MPNRLMSESLCTSEKIAGLSDFEYRLWTHLILLADDAGRGDARPAIIKGRSFPLRERVSLKDIDSALHTLAARGCVSLYTVGGKPYYVFPHWAAHQRIRDSKPKYPSPEGADVDCSPQFAASCGELPPESNPIQSKSESNPTTNPMRAAAYFLDKVNPDASPRSLEELSAFVSFMGDEICIAAIEIAIDEKKPVWSYVRGILRRWQLEGVKCIADVKALDDRHKQGKVAGKRSQGATKPQPGKPGEADQRARDDMDRLRKMMEEGKL